MSKRTRTPKSAAYWATVAHEAALLTAWCAAALLLIAAGVFFSPVKPNGLVFWALGYAAISCVAFYVVEVFEEKAKNEKD